ncbi:alpha/beta fold hydrolase [Streptomyces sp. NPDC059525]|uniref:alpha/beta fold hydrolase n=1 Tax=Streptomyces sp. NPDC059525 TaxID=3346857 RepID=UPI0036CBF7C3
MFFAARCPGAYDSRNLKLAVDTRRALGAPGGDGRVLASYLSLLVGGTRWLDARSEGEIGEQLELFAAGIPPGTDAQLALFDELDVRADLARIDVPVLVVSPWGDLLITPIHSLELAGGGSRGPGSRPSTAVTPSRRNSRPSGPH